MAGVLSSSIIDDKTRQKSRFSFLLRRGFPSEKTNSNLLDSPSCRFIEAPLVIHARIIKAAFNLHPEVVLVLQQHPAMSCFSYETNFLKSSNCQLSAGFRSPPNKDQSSTFHPPSTSLSLLTRILVFYFYSLTSFLNFTRKANLRMR